jgi:hypothetical protein
VAPGCKQRPNETFAKAYTRLITEDEVGRVLYAAYEAANGPDYENRAPQPSRPQDPPMTPSLAQIYRLAADVRNTNPKLTEAQAFTRVLESPEGKKLYRQYRSEQSAG